MTKDNINAPPRIPLNSDGYLLAQNYTDYGLIPVQLVNGVHKLQTAQWPMFSSVSWDIDGVSWLEFRDKCCLFIYCKHQAIYNDPEHTPTADVMGSGTEESPFVSIQDALDTAFCYLRRTCWNIKVVIDAQSDPIAFPSYNYDISYRYYDRLWVVCNGVEIIPQNKRITLPTAIVSDFVCNIKDVEVYGHTVYKANIKDCAFVDLFYLVDSVIDATADGAVVEIGLRALQEGYCYNSKIIFVDGQLNSRGLIMTDVSFTPTERRWAGVTSDFIYSSNVYGEIINIKSPYEEDPDQDCYVATLRCYIGTAVKSSFTNCAMSVSGILKEVSYTTNARTSPWLGYYFIEPLTAAAMDDVAVNINIPKARLYQSSTSPVIIGVVQYENEALHNVRVNININQIVPFPSDGDHSGVVVICDIAKRTSDGYRQCISNCRKLTFHYGNAPFPDESKISCDWLP